MKSVKNPSKIITRISNIAEIRKELLLDYYFSIGNIVVE